MWPVRLDVSLGEQSEVQRSMSQSAEVERTGNAHADARAAATGGAATVDRTAVTGAAGGTTRRRAQPGRLSRGAPRQGDASG
jgi:hypothetical protein